MLITFLIKNKNWHFSLICIIYFIGVFLTIYIRNEDLANNFKDIINCLAIPIFCLFFSTTKAKVSIETIIKIFYLFTIFFLLNINISFKEQLISIIVVLMPVIVEYLKKHHNWFAKIVGIIFLITIMILLKSNVLILSFIISFIFLLWPKNKKIVSLLALIIVGFYCFKTLDISYLNENIFHIFFGLSNLSSSSYIINLGLKIGVVGILLYLLIFIHLAKKHLSLKYLIYFILMAIATNYNFYASIFIALLIVSPEIKKTKKILIVSNMYPSKRAKHYGVFVQNMVTKLNANNYNVSLAVMHKHKNFISKALAYTLFYLKAFLKALFGSYDYIYVHFISHSTAPVLFGYSWCDKTKLILNAHGNDVVPDFLFETNNVNRSKKYLKYASKIVVSSNYFKKRLINDYQLSPDKIAIYHAGGINLETFYKISKKEAKENLKLDPKYEYIGFISRIEKNKGYDTLIEAIYMLKEELKNTKIIIIGEGEEENKLNYLISKYHLQDYIIRQKFVYQQDLLNYYNAFSLFVFPTKRESESLGLVGLEAMACQTFVIACDLYGPSEYLKDGINSLTYQDISSGKSLARKIRMYYNMNEKERKKITLNGYKTAQEYSFENTFLELLKIFGEEK